MTGPNFPFGPYMPPLTPTQKSTPLFPTYPNQLARNSHWSKCY